MPIHRKTGIFVLCASCDSKPQAAPTEKTRVSRTRLLPPAQFPPSLSESHDSVLENWVLGDLAFGRVWSTQSPRLPAAQWKEPVAQRKRDTGTQLTAQDERLKRQRSTSPIQKRDRNPFKNETEFGPGGMVENLTVDPRQVSSRDAGSSPPSGTRQCCHGNRQCCLCGNNQQCRPDGG